MSALDDPCSVYNTNEISLFLYIKGKFTLFVKGGSTYDYDVSKTSDNKNITTLLMANATGEITPSLTVFKYRRQPQQMVTFAPEKW